MLDLLSLNLHMNTKDSIFLIILLVLTSCDVWRKESKNNYTLKKTKFTLTPKLIARYRYGRFYKSFLFHVTQISSYEFSSSNS